MSIETKTTSHSTIWDFMLSVLKSGNAIVTFTKANGEERVMKCTLRPEAYAEYSFKSGSSGSVTKCDDIQPVWDLEKNAWRSIKYGTIVSVEEIE